MAHPETHYSPLDAITTGKVGRLDLAWTFDTESAGNLEATPLVADGVMYAATTWSYVFAVDARTGELIWRCGPAGSGVFTFALPQ